MNDINIKNDNRPVDTSGVNGVNGANGAYGVNGAYGANEIQKREAISDKEAINEKVYSSIALYSQLGLSMSVCVVIGIFGGIYLDRWLGVSPLFLFVGCLLGTGASFKALYDLVVKRSDKNTKKTPKERR